jgi:hypothetical protein
MASSSNPILLIFFLAFAVLTAALQPTATADADEPQFGRWPRCIPAGRPRHPFLPPCPPPPSPSSPAPSECYTPLSGMATPCADFLTNRGARGPPPSACCDGFKAAVTAAPICMCHVVDNGFSKLLPAPMLRLRMMVLPRACRVAFPLAVLHQCSSKPRSETKSVSFLFISSLGCVTRLISISERMSVTETGR